MKLLLFTLANSEKIIKNVNIPSCRNCVHFKPPSYGEFTSSYSKCGKFDTKNILTDTVSYNYADMSRRDETKCGNEGKYFEQEKNIEFKIFIHNEIRNLPNIIILSTFWYFNSL